MDEALLRDYRDTAYLVCVDTIEWACIRVDRSLPNVLQLKVGAHSWGFITAWNPHSVARALAANLAAQRELLADLQATTDVSVFTAIGIGSSGWHEPSLFVIGPDQPTLDALARRYRQRAYICGKRTEPACLRVLTP